MKIKYKVWLSKKNKKIKSVIKNPFLQTVLEVVLNNKILQKARQVELIHPIKVPTANNKDIINILTPPIELANKETETTMIVTKIRKIDIEERIID